MSSGRLTYELPCGWKPGYLIREPDLSGPLHAILTEAGPRAWLGKGQVPTLWPQGWCIRSDLGELVDPQGRVFAREGELVHASGGLVIPGLGPRGCGGGDRVVSLDELWRSD